MDKVLLKFFADVLYVKGLICSEEIDDIYDVATPKDLDKVFEKMMNGGYNVYKKGESYYKRE